MQEDGDNLSHEEFMALQLAALEQYERNRMPTISEHEEERQREQVKVCTHITVNEFMLLSFLQYLKQLLNYTYLNSRLFWYLFLPLVASDFFSSSFCGIEGHLCSRPFCHLSKPKSSNPCRPLSKERNVWECHSENQRLPGHHRH